MDPRVSGRSASQKVMFLKSSSGMDRVKSVLYENVSLILQLSLIHIYHWGVFVDVTVLDVHIVGNIISRARARCPPNYRLYLITGVYWICLLNMSKTGLDVQVLDVTVDILYYYVKLLNHFTFLCFVMS